MAALVNYLAALVNYLGETSAFINSLEPDEKESYERGFIEIHDALLDQFMQSIDGICKEWVESEAGAAFIALWVRLR